MTAAGMGALALAATGLLAPLLGVSPWSLVGVEQAFWACMVCASAGERESLVAAAPTQLRLEQPGR